MQIVMRKASELVPYERNPRNNEKAVDAVVASIKQFGFNVPIIIDKDGVIVAGHTRYKAAMKIGLDEVPTITAENLTPEQIKAFRIVDNKTADLARWDWELLRAELESIEGVDMSAFAFGSFDAGPDDGEKTKIETNLDEGMEIDLAGFADEAFNMECPYCGFRWNK